MTVLAVPVISSVMVAMPDRMNATWVSGRLLTGQPPGWHSQMPMFPPAFGAILKRPS